MGLLTNTSSKKSFSAAILRHSSKTIVLSFICGVLWFAALVSDVFNNKTYFSENALLPGLVTRDFKPRSSLSRTLSSLEEEAKAHSSDIPSAWILGQFRQLGLDVYRNNFTAKYPFGARSIYKGDNLYAILRAPKIPSTEAIVISTPYRDFSSIHDDTLASVALMIELAREFRRQTYWSKDIIFLVTQYENIGFQAWLDAYHGVSTSSLIASEKLASTSGPIQGVINLEVSGDRFSHIDVKIEGLHGQLPNLDFFNLVIEVCSREDVPTTFQSQFNYYPSRLVSLKGWKHNFITVSKMVLLQATGLPSGGHGLFHRFGIQALTLKSSKEKSRGTVSIAQLGRSIEGITRGLNNLLEKFHQSFFFYLLPSTRNYISIGSYMPPFALIAIPVLIKALYLYINILSLTVSDKNVCPEKVSVNYWNVAEIFTLHLIFGTALFILPNHVDFFRSYFPVPTEDLVYYIVSVCILIWILVTSLINISRKISVIEFSYKMCIGLLVLGSFLFTLALVNISLALILAVLFVPVSISLTYKGKLAFLQNLYLMVINPFTLTIIVVMFQSYGIDSNVSLMTHLGRSIEGHKKLLLYSIEDMYFFGNWNYRMVSLMILPIWCNLWSISVSRVE